MSWTDRSTTAPAALDRLPQVTTVVIAALAGDPVRVGLAEVAHALVGVEVVLDPVPDAGRVLPQERVAAVAVHVAPGRRDATVTHEVRDLVRRLGLEGPEVPLHVVIAHLVVGAPLLRMDEVLEVLRVAHEEDRRVVADEVVVALFGVELQREAARVTPGVRGAQLAGHRREPGDRLGFPARLEHSRLGELRDIVGGLEEPERAAALGVYDPLRHALPVELGHLLDEVVVLQQDRAAIAEGQRVVVAGDRDAGVGCGRGHRGFGHERASAPAVGRHEVAYGRRKAG